MIQIERALISLDIFEKKFCCDLGWCRGACCIEGDSGAPLEEEELKEIEHNYSNIKMYMKPEGIRAVEEQGFGGVDIEGDLVTTLIGGGECAYAINQDGICWCAIEKAWSEGKSSFRKPVSCHLYPVRITRYPDYDAVNYHKWKICSCARVKGEQEQIPLYRFLREAFIAKYGDEWYKQLEYAAHEIETGKIKC